MKIPVDRIEEALKKSEASLRIITESSKYWDYPLDRPTIQYCEGNSSNQ